MHDLAIIGGGPAGTAIAVYAARKRLNSVLITKEWGGQSNVSSDIQNWIGTPHISGADLANAFEDHVREYANDVVEVVSSACVTSISKTSDGFSITTDKDNTYEARAIFLGMGSARRKLTAENADAFEHKGLTYCATCDGPLFTGRDVAVIGGGNAGFETAAQLLEYTNSVTLFQHRDKFTADEITIEKVRKNDKFTGLTNVEVTEILGDQMVTGLVYEDMQSGEKKQMDVGGVFVEIGMIPNTDVVADIVELNKRKQIIVDPYTQRASTEGIWAAGDCTDGRYHQNNIAAGDAVKAIEDMYHHLR